MGPEELVRACLGEMRERDGLAVAGDVAETHRVALLGTVGTAAVLIGFGLAVQDSDRDDALELFEALIRAALQDEAGGGRIGARFLGEAARAMGLPAVTERLVPVATHDLARAYARAGAPPPPELVQHMIGQMDALREAGRLPVDPDTEIERMSVLLDVDEDHIEHFLHGKLDERIGTLPEEAAGGLRLRGRVSGRGGRAGGSPCTGCWTNAAEVRLGAADGFRERALRGIVDPVSAGMVPLIRNWMPADAGRTLLDEALAEARRRELVAPLPRPEWRRAEIYGSIPDMWGTQMLRVVLQGREEPAVATVVTEPGQGIAQAIVISGMEAIGELTGGDIVRRVDRDPVGDVRGAGCRGTGRGAGGWSGRRPAGLIDVVLVVRDVGAAAARDERRETGCRSSTQTKRLPPYPAPVREELIGGSAAWRDDYRRSEGLVGRGRRSCRKQWTRLATAAGVKAGFFTRLEPRREAWAVRMLRSAHVLKGAGNVDWKTFAGTARGRAGRPGAGDDSRSWSMSGRGPTGFSPKKNCYEVKSERTGGMREKRLSARW